jgi:hypothetical protein
MQHLQQHAMPACNSKDKSKSTDARNSMDISKSGITINSKEASHSREAMAEVVQKVWT